MVLYFSGTGNSRYTARTIADIADDTLVSLNERIKNNDISPLESKKPYVLVCPVYAGRIPRIVEEHIMRTAFYGTDKIYLIVTCAQTPWVTEKYLNKLCEKKKLVSQGFSSIVMPQNYIANGATQPESVNKEVFTKGALKVGEISDYIREQKKLPAEKPGKSIMSVVLNPMMYKMMITAKPFYTTSACNGCGLCVEKCPLNNIQLSDGTPKWGKNCTHCMACISSCPKEAIEYGKKSVGKTRYYLE